MAISWRDALKRAAAPTAATQAAPADPVPVDPASIDPATVSPALRALLDDRRRMEAEIATLTGAAPNDPRHPVASLAERRAELGRWAEGRDAARPVPASAPRATPRAADAGRPASERADSGRAMPDRSIAGRMLDALAPARGDPPLRTTPGEMPGGTPTRADAFAALRDAARGDVSGLLDRTLDRIVPATARPLRGEDVLARAKKAIPDDWRERARRMVPVLGDDSSYARRARELLTVAVGSVDELTSKAEKLRDLAQDVRELRQADEAGDEKRRDRALERLKAKRQES